MKRLLTLTLTLTVWRVGLCLRRGLDIAPTTTNPMAKTYLNVSNLMALQLSMVITPPLLLDAVAQPKDPLRNLSVNRKCGTILSPKRGTRVNNEEFSPMKA